MRVTNQPTIAAQEKVDQRITNIRSELMYLLPVRHEVGPGLFKEYAFRVPRMCINDVTALPPGFKIPVAVDMIDKLAGATQCISEQKRTHRGHRELRF